MHEFAHEVDVFIAELDMAVEAHLAWVRRILRCAVQRAMPGEDVLSHEAHTLCRFGAWFAANSAHFETIDAPAARRIEAVHKAMHDAIRSICNRMLDAQPVPDDALEAFEQAQAELLSLLARFKTLVLSSAQRHDPLTGLPLRHSIEYDFTLYQRDARRKQHAVYVVMIDVDHFKHINDSYGHPVGDMVLCHLADTLKRSLRENEPLYRYGGEEFLVLMQCASPAEAESLADRLVTTVRNAPVLLGNEPVALTVTLGLAEVGELEGLASAIRRSDKALYRGKKSGRNRYVIDTL
ncbi:MAG: diguanylate cyclase [Thiobacillus sp.]|nr:diguanylate cyclase [Thiobacillus sp.]